MVKIFIEKEKENLFIFRWKDEISNFETTSQENRVA